MHLGVPFGTPSFLHQKLGDIARSSLELLEINQLQDDPQVALLLLRMSAAPRFGQLIRAMSLYSPQLVDHLTLHDTRMMASLERILGPDELSELQRAKVQLPIRMGGFGLLSAVRTHVAGYFGSFVGCLQDVWLRAQSLLPSPANLNSFFDLPWVREARTAWFDDGRMEKIRAECAMPSLPLEQLTQNSWPHHHSFLSSLIHRAELESLQSSASVHDQVRFRSHQLLSTASKCIHAQRRLRRPSSRDVWRFGRRDSIPSPCSGWLCGGAPGCPPVCGEEG